MGYDTSFKGVFELTPALTAEQTEALCDYTAVQHKPRQETADSLACPGGMCPWVPSDDGTALKWDGVEKPYDYVEWLLYLISDFLTPLGVMANGEVVWNGESMNDMGIIYAKDNVVEVHASEFVTPRPSWEK